MDYDGKKIGSYTLSDEAQGLREYVDNDIASYITYNCAYCKKKNKKMVSYTN